jgi:hypothetical protein
LELPVPVRGSRLLVSRGRVLASKPPLMIAPRKQLKLALESHLLPVFSSAGFSGPSSLKGHGLCYAFQRCHGDGYRFLTIQFEKCGGPQFRVNFSEATQEGLQQRRRFMEERLQRPVTEDMLSEPWGCFRGHLHPSRLPYFKLFTWFGTRGALFGIGAGSPEIVALRAAALYPEIESWWRDRKVGPHLWIPDLLFLGRRRINQTATA